MPHTFEDLVQLEQTAVAAHAALQAADDPAAARQEWLAAAAAFQAAVTETAGDTSRVELEMAVKKAVRHPETADARQRDAPPGITPAGRHSMS